jgi:hypothetical protein
MFTCRFAHFRSKAILCTLVEGKPMSMEIGDKEKPMMVIRAVFGLSSMHRLIDFIYRPCVWFADLFNL